MESEQLSFESAIDFSNEIVEERLNNVIALYDFFDRFGEIYRREKKRLPYHINIIDELRANDRALYYGISTLFATDVKDMRLKFERIVEDFDFEVDDRWYGSKYCSFEDAYIELKNLINRVIA